MRKCVLGCAFACLAAVSLGVARLSGAQGSDPSIDMSRQRKDKLRKSCPSYLRMEEELAEARKGMMRILGEYRKGRIDRAGARDQLEPLLRQEIELSRSIDYKMEEQLCMLLEKPEKPAKP